MKANQTNQTSRSSQIETLAQLPIGVSAKVVSIAENGAISKRLMEMGVVPGVAVRVIKAAPFGSPLEIRVRGYHLALRLSEAESIGISQ